MAVIVNVTENIRRDRMATLTIRYYSTALTECNSMNIVLPSGNGPWPVVWLLAPMGCGYTCWGAHTDMEALAEQKQKMLVMPDLKLSCGLDMIHGLRYHTMLVSELPVFLSTHFSVDLNSQIIVGAKEGAYVALYAAADGKQNYEKVIALSGGSLPEEKNIDEDLRFCYAFGDRVSSLKESSYNVEKQVEEIQKSSKIYVAYGLKDSYSYSASRLAAKVPPTYVDISTGTLDWTKWYQILKKRI